MDLRYPLLCPEIRLDSQLSLQLPPPLLVRRGSPGVWPASKVSDQSIHQEPEVST